MKKNQKSFFNRKGYGSFRKFKKKLHYNLEFINKDILSVDETKLTKEKLIVFGNLPYNISTEILTKWILNIKSSFWFEKLILMFQKEVADRIISTHNMSNYGRLSIISNWKLNIKKVIDIKPISFSPKPKVNSTLLMFNFQRGL